MAEEIVEPSHIGHFRISGGHINWPPHGGVGPVLPSRVINVTLHAYNGNSIVSGSGMLIVTPPGKPPIYTRLQFKGTSHVQSYGVGKAFQTFALHGTPFASAPGSTFVSQLVIHLKTLWGPDGTATYTLETSGVEHPSEVVIKDAEVNVRWVVKESIPVLEE
ncbi:hypothetical protein WJ70_19890 [Burkholderia ubonensis]|uniref:hypothetical protein n=1 Tax=Burkholderia ubonensis TaxID=101571 RepID=UPI0007526919|nr:hypothetical protein [Burkholderia ubonensis]KVN89209.1 hypothetical protein WJ70_19890 [Burkholderia ubonensis]